MARQLGWGWAGLPCPAETWPVPGALAGGGNEGGQSGVNHHSAPARARVWDPDAGGWSRHASHNGGRQQSASGRFKAEGPDPLAQGAERI